MTFPRHVVVTGASGGIGRAVAHRFTRDSAMVANLDLLPGAEAEALCGPSLRTIAVDLADADSITAAFTQVDALFGQPPDVLVCCAAISAAHPFLDVPTAVLDRLLAVNVRGTFLACQAAARRMRPAGRGHIVVITSVAADQAWAGEMVYGATKAAQRSLVQGMAVELAPFGILVNAVGPGIVEHRSTTMARTRDDAAVHQHDLDRTPLARFGAPEEIAEAVHFLTSVTWMTGQTVYVDGGFLASGLAYFGQTRAKLTGGLIPPSR